MPIYEDVVNDLLQVIVDSGGKMTYEAWSEHFTRQVTDAMLAYLRGLVTFSLENEAGELVHYVSYARADGGN